MANETVHAEWVRDQVFLLKDRAGFPVVMAQPEGVNGADLLPMSLIGCAAWDIISILRKQRQQVTSLEISAESQREPEPPWRYLNIRIRYRIRGHDLSEKRIRRAVELTETKYCGIFATLRLAVNLESEIEISPP